MRVLVTGGAGYIGSHAVRYFIDQGHEVAVLDDLSTGHLDAVDPRADFVVGSVADIDSCRRALHRCEAVVHFAASSIVSESVSAPLKYWANNVVGAVTLLQAMQEAQCKQLVLSSTAATYGHPEHSPITEDCRQRPINPYGSSKLAVEHMVSDVVQAHSDFSATVFRYFNVAGCAWGLAERHDPETHLIPILMDAARGLRRFSIFGEDYPTPDGTCVRDFVHVVDLVEAHALAIESPQPGIRQINLGTGRGYSVREVVDAAREVTGASIPVTVAPRRAGDPSTLVTSNDEAYRALGWTPRRSSLDEILRSVWNPTDEPKF